jgi:hypothetical protein
MELVFGQNKKFEGFCNICGLPLEEGVCRKTHKIRVGRQKKYSGRSKSVNKFNNYQ